MITVVSFLILSIISKLAAADSVGYIPGYGYSEGVVPDVLAVLVIVFLFAAFCADVLRGKKTKKYASILILAALLRLFLVLFDRFGQSIYHLPNSGADSSMFFRNAALFALKDASVNRGAGFSTVMGWFFKLTGVSQTIGQYIVALFSLLALIFLSKTMDEISDNNPLKKKVLLIVGLLPNFAILSSIFLRESIVTMLLSWSVFHFVRWMKYRSQKSFVLAFAFTLAAAIFHSGSVALAVGYILVCFLYDASKGRFHFSLKNVSIAVLLSFGLAFLYLNYGELFFEKMVGTTELEDIGNTSDLGGSSYAEYVGNSASIGNMVIYTPLRIVYFLFSPFPWQWRGLSDIIASFFSGVYYFVAAYKGLIALKKSPREVKKYALAVALMAAMITFVFAWGVANTGTATRHRDKLVTIYAVLLLLGGERKKWKNT